MIKKTALFAAILALGLGASPTEAAAAPPGPTKIKDCGDIAESGSYVLVNNISAASDCIRVLANFVTIDLAGFTVTGGGEFIGVQALLDVAALTLRNGTIENFSVGIATGGTPAALGSGHLIENVRTIDNGQLGILMVGGSGHRVTGNIALSNGLQGIGVTCPSIVEKNISENNGDDDIHVESGTAADCLFRDNVPDSID